ncbi:hypothetical protein WA026_009356 [Henosepilachna vigintioctopunctata]|uniref:Uncharacterized protein n=1 Tax=Henosepilachna vigintioctopunctata TaxID=420089 RepID=A0AAW1U3I3_9CUCU
MGLFNVLIRSKLEYGSMIWHPIYTCLQRHLEAIQRRFLRFLVCREDKICSQRGVNHDELLSRFSLMSLQSRRQTLSLVLFKFLYKLLHNSIDCPPLQFTLRFRVPWQNSRSTELFHLETQITNPLI